MRILLAGQPNCGKTTLFNRLTGRREHTGNRAGVTVSCARARLRGWEEELVDLPGLYSLTGGGPDEQAARRALETEAPDLILNVVDSTALRRSLVLTLQLLALGRPTAVLLNMADEARQRGIRIDIEKLSKMLGVPVFFVSARTGEGLDALERVIRGLFPLPQVPAGEILTNARQAEAVGRALESLRAARAAMELGCTPDIVLTECETAMSALGELSGRSVREDVTARIFERFCVGK